MFIRDESKSSDKNTYYVYWNRICELVRVDSGFLVFDPVQHKPEIYLVREDLQISTFFYDNTIFPFAPSNMLFIKSSSCFPALIQIEGIYFALCKILDASHDDSKVVVFRFNTIFFMFHQLD